MQWMNFQWINRFVNPMQLCISCEKSGGLLLAELGLMTGWLADEIQMESKNLKLAVDR